MTPFGQSECVVSKSDCSAKLGFQGNESCKHGGPPNVLKMSRNASAPWTLEATTVLIENYSKHDNLYNSKSVHYHNKFLRIKSLHDIVASVEPYRPGTTTQDIKAKINTLRSQFGVEEQRIRSSMKSGCSPNEGELAIVDEDVIPAKRLKMELGDVKASKCEELRDKIVKSSDTTSVESPTLNLAKFLCHGLEGLKNPRRRLLTTKKIFDILLEAQLEELEEEERN